MKAHEPLHNRILAAFMLIFLSCAPVFAETKDVNALLEQLAQSTEENYAGLESDILREWSKSGSAAMDLLLERGQQAMQQGDFEAAIEHLTALTDHAPEFAEGWNALATAYFQAGEFGPSIADIRRTLALNPKHFGALAGFGMILEELGRDKQALEIYRAALAIHPHLQGVLDGVKRLEEAAAGKAL